MIVNYPTSGLCRREGAGRVARPQRLLGQAGIEKALQLPVRMGLLPDGEGLAKRRVGLII
jgi:hypothetical protein